MYADPTGHVITATIITFALIGASIAFVATAYYDYADDGEVFNGSIDAGSYVANILVGGAIGGGAAYLAPEIGAFLTTNFFFSMPSLVAGGEAVAVTISGAQIAAGVAAGVGIMLFASNSRPGDNKKQNKQFRDAMRKLDITDKDKMRRVHDKIKGRNMGYNELLDFIRKILNIE